MGRITREGETPLYGIFITSYCITDPERGLKRDQFPEALKAVALPDGPRDITIPTWQRKLVWDGDNIDELLTTESKMYGSVILAKAEAMCTEACSFLLWKYLNFGYCCSA